AEYFDANLSLLDTGGRLVVLGLLTGAVAGSIDLGRVLRQRLMVVGTAMRSRSASERAELVQRFVSDILPHLNSGQLRAVVDRSVPWAEAAAGYELLGSNTT